MIFDLDLGGVLSLVDLRFFAFCVESLDPFVQFFCHACFID